MIYDNYTHCNDNIYYIVENILGPAEETSDFQQLLNDFNSELYEHCDCSGVCDLPFCKCLLKSCGGNYTTQTHWKCNLKSLTLNSTKTSPIFECNKFCLCSSDCSNRVVQNGPIDCLEIKQCDKGLCLFTTRFICKGTFICEYAGELITNSQANLRHQQNLINGAMNYIFCLKEHTNNSVIKTFVDPSVFGNIGRYMNHSCEPNCHIVPVRCDSPIPKLAIFTLSNVLPMTELTFHYGYDSSDLQLSHRIKCLCKSKYCSGFIPFHMY